MTLPEMVIAVVIMTIVFAAIVPQFSIIRSSWDSKAGIAETLQNGRVLMDHINRNLSKAVSITSVSESDDTDGYIEFEDNDGNTLRYDIADNNYVEYGVVGNLSDLAGPVGSMTFSCYDACDLDTVISPVSDVNIIRAITAEAIFTSSSGGRDLTFTTTAYLRTNGNDSAQGTCWQNQDVGDVGAAGSATQTEDGWTIEGSGYDIMYNTDEFHYVYQPLSGDGQIIARVASIENTGSYAKAGVMIRETLTGDSKYAGIFVTPYNGVYFQRRTSTSGSTSFTSGSGSQAPRWFKLTRSGNTFAGYESSNGSTWTQVGSSVSITMPTDVYIGLAVGSNNDGVLCTAEFDNISSSEITYETFNEAKVGSDNTSITISTPSTNQGDLLIAAVATDGDTSGSLAPPGGEGWTEIDIDDYSSEVTLGGWWKLAEATESSSHQFSWAGGQQAYGWMMRFTGHDSADPIDVSIAGGSSSSTPTSPAVTTTVDNCMIVRLGAFDDDNITVDNPGLSGHTAITMDKSAASSSGAVAILGSWTSGLTHTAESGSNRLLVFTAHAEEAGAINLSSVTYGGRSMTKVIDKIVGTNPQAYVVAYILDEAGIAAATSNTFIPNWSTTPDEVSYSSVFLSNVNQTTPVGATASNGTAYSTPNPITTSALSTGVGDMVVVAAMCGNVGDYTVNNGFTEAIEFDMATSTGVAGYKSATGVNETPSVTHTWVNRQVIIGFVVQTGGGTGGTVSGGAGYVMQPASGSSGTSTFSLGSSNEAQMLTIAIAPDSGSAGCGESIRP